MMQRGCSGGGLFFEYPLVCYVLEHSLLFQVPLIPGKLLVVCQITSLIYRNDCLTKAIQRLPKPSGCCRAQPLEMQRAEEAKLSWLPGHRPPAPGLPGRLRRGENHKHQMKTYHPSLSRQAAEMAVTELSPLEDHQFRGHGSCRGSVV